jgi:hypothetical protein
MLLQDDDDSVVSELPPLPQLSVAPPPVSEAHSSEEAVHFVFSAPLVDNASTRRHSVEFAATASDAEPATVLPASATVTTFAFSPPLARQYEVLSEMSRTMLPPPAMTNLLCDKPAHSDDDGDQEDRAADVGGDTAVQLDKRIAPASKRRKRSKKEEDVSIVLLTPPTPAPETASPRRVTRRSSMLSQPIPRQLRSKDYHLKW